MAARGWRSAVSTPPDPLLDRALHLLEELRGCAEDADLDERGPDLLTRGYASALALEAARRRLRSRALELSRRELALAAQEQELRELLAALRKRLGRPQRASGREAAPQRLH